MCRNANCTSAWPSRAVSRVTLRVEAVFVVFNVSVLARRDGALRSGERAAAEVEAALHATAPA